MSEPINVLFLCTGNSARSIMGEAYLRHVGGARFAAYSAGSNPTGQVNPAAIETLKAEDIDTAGLTSKAWDVFTGPDAPTMDVIITVCDNAAGEACPIWPGHPTTTHWGLPDAAAATGAATDISAAFESVFAVLRKLVDDLIAQDADSLAPDRVRETLAAIGARHLPAKAAE